MKKREAIFIFSGLSGGSNESLVRESKVFFVKKGFDVYTFELISDELVQKRDFRKTTFESFLQKTEKKYYQVHKKHSKIHFIGHSFGALLFLALNKKVINNGVIALWDASLPQDMLHWIENSFVLDIKKTFYIEQLTKKPIIFSKALYNEIRNYSMDNSLFTDVKNKIIIFGAEKGAVQNAEKIFSFYKKKRSNLYIVKNTGHLFSGYKSRQYLFSKTYHNIIDSN